MINGSDDGGHGAMAMFNSFVLSARTDIFIYISLLGMWVSCWIKSMDTSCDAINLSGDGFGGLQLAKKQMNS